MTNVYRYRVLWSGFTGSPGTSTFYYSSAVDPASALHALYTSVASHFPGAVAWDFPLEGDIIDMATGTLTGTWTSAGAAHANGSGVVDYSSVSGAAFRWKTNVAVAGRKVKGHTFMVPLDISSYDAGVVGSAMVSVANSALATYLASAAGAVAVVYSRPRPGRSGAISAITGASCLTKVVTLRSRRD